MLNVDDSTFQSEVLGREGAVLVAYFIEGQDASARLLAFLGSIKPQCVERVQFAQVNVTRSEGVSHRMRIFAVPALGYYVNGQESFFLFPPLENEQILASLSAARIVTSAAGGNP